MKVLCVSHPDSEVAGLLSHSSLDYRILPPSSKYSLTPTLLRRQVREFNPDIILSQGVILTLGEWLLLRPKSKKFVAYLGDTGQTPLSRLVVRELRKSDLVIVTSEGGRQELLKEMGNNPAVVSVLPNFCDVAKFDKAKVQHNGKVILTVIDLSNAGKATAMETFFSAIASVLREDDTCRYRLILTGEYKGRTLWYIGTKMNNLGGRIEISGMSKNLCEEYQRADVFCYYSNQDECPREVLAAWASHTPVVANKLGWSESLIGNNEAGLLADTPEETADNIKILLSDAAERAAVTEKGYECVVNHFSETVVGEQLRRSLQGLVAVPTLLLPAPSLAHYTITRSASATATKKESSLRESLSDLLDPDEERAESKMGDKEGTDE